MEKIIHDVKNSLLNRREIKLIVKAPSNPGFANAIKMVSDDLKAKEELIAVNEVKSKFGRDTFLIDAFIYGSAEDKNKVERKPKVKKAKEGQ